MTGLSNAWGNVCDSFCQCCALDWTLRITGYRLRKWSYRARFQMLADYFFSQPVIPITEIPAKVTNPTFVFKCTADIALETSSHTTLETEGDVIYIRLSSNAFDRGVDTATDEELRKRVSDYLQHGGPLYPPMPVSLSELAVLFLLLSSLY